MVNDVKHMGISLAIMISYMIMPRIEGRSLVTYNVYRNVNKNNSIINSKTNIYIYNYLYMIGYVSNN